MQSNVESFSSPKAVEVYARKLGLLNRHEEAAFAHFAAPGRVLDLGCGVGRTTTWLADKGLRVVGVDIAPTMVEEARRLHDGLDFQVGDASDLDFDAGSFDYVLFSFNGLDCLHPRELREATLRGVHRVLRPGGLFVFSSHNRAWTWLPTRRRLTRVREAGDGYFRERTVYGELTLKYSFPWEVERELGGAGLRLLRSYGRIYGSWIYYVAEKAG